MPLTISDEVLRDAGITAAEARLELACRLFDIGRLDLPSAARLAAVDRGGFEAELARRRIPALRPTIEDLDRDVRTLDALAARGVVKAPR